VGVIVVSGEPGSRAEEVARLAAQCLPETELLSAGRLNTLMAEETGDARLPEVAWADLATVIVARAAVDHHLLLNVAGAEHLLENVAPVLRVRVVASEAYRAGTVMLERRLERPAALETLRGEDEQARSLRRRRFGKGQPRWDLSLNADALTVEQMAAVIAQTARTLGTLGAKLASGAEAQMQFQARMRLAEHGIHPPGKAGLRRRVFANRSEEIFANLLDFYRIDWQYEPRSFVIAWDERRQPAEQFTPDFFLPEFDLYVELTTMKQSLVTKKNRKVKLLKQHYPEVNIQVFYQRDFQNLIFKHGIQERLATL
jgi:hypothetical protein